LALDLKQRGSVSIEFILLLAISLVYINGVIWPITLNSSQATADIKAIADTKVSAMKLANALDQAITSDGDMKKTMNFFVPENGSITCNGDKVEYAVLVDYMRGWNPDETNCVVEPDAPADPIGWKCSSYVELIADPGSGCPAMDGPLFQELVVKKTSGTISVDWA